jgi:guanylate kinase
MTCCSISASAGALVRSSKIPDAVSIFILLPNRSELNNGCDHAARTQKKDPKEVGRGPARGLELRKYDYIFVNDRLMSL